MNGSMYKLPKGRYRIRWRDPGGRERSKTLDDRTQARQWLGHVRHRTSIGELPLPQSKTFDEFLEVWWPRKAAELRPTTRAAYEGILRLHLPEEMRTRALRSVTPSDIQSVLRRLADRGHFAQARKARAVMHVLFEDAARDGLAGLNPVAHARVPREPTRSRVARCSEPGECPSPEDVWRIAEACPDWARAVVLVAGFAGVRWGEIAALRPEDVDLERCEIRVEGSYAELAHEVGPPKSEASVRRALFAEAIQDGLAEHLERFATTDLAFPSSDGRRLHHSNFRRRVWLPARQSLGHPWRFHDLRHTYASILIGAGVGPPVAARLLGHSSPAVTLDVYAGFWDGQIDAARDALRGLGR
jgi:integrase